MPELPKTYAPQEVEPRWYQRWLDDKAFVADPARVGPQRPAYSIVIPPPNVTGILTLGHVLNNTIQDILARRARMLGKEVLWLPGTDHAGIATERQVERMVKKEEHKSKQELGREEFIKRVWTWKEKFGGIIIQQLKKLGCSCDWSRERFTADPGYSLCVTQVFVDLYKKGLIYRGKRMVNWCPVSLTAISDEEVIMKEQKGVLYHFKVEVVEQPGTWLEIATTRPETIPGDTAIAVNPKDERYKHLIGKHARRPLPIENQAALPIIADEHIDPQFGTGVLKVTPAHDKADFEIGRRHGLAPIDIMNPNATMNDLAGEALSGLDRFEARAAAVEELRNLKALVKEVPHQNNVGFSERADVPIEPRLSEQWFLKYPSREPSHGVVASGRMKFHPDRWAKVYDHWMTNLQDWCISRQLWWGHRVPVWTKRVTINDYQLDADVFGWSGLESSRKGNEEAGRVVRVIRASDGLEVDPEDHGFRKSTTKDDTETFDVFVATADTSLGERLGKHGFTQDPDVLDTWFSSWLWPFATMGWPEQTATLKAFYPTTDLVTGPDIIFFWVARMIMAGYEYMGEMPFRNVYFTGIIRDKQGRKMSKTLGNSPDPLELIAKYGADALRFGIMRSAPLGQDILFDEKNVELGRNFCTKLWNAARFRQMQSSQAVPAAGEAGVLPDIEGEINPALLTTDDKWILLRLDAAITEVTASLEEYRFSDAAATLHRFFWSEYCDWYLEASKAVLNGTDATRRGNTLAVMDFVLGNTMRLFHPFLPFITEELWHGMGFNRDMPESQGGRSIMTAPWPKELDQEEKAHFGLGAEVEKAASDRYETVNLGRGLKSTFNITKRARFVLKPNRELPAHEVEVLKILLNAEPLDVDRGFAPTKGTPVALTPMGELFLPLEGLVDIAAERARITKELAKVEAELEKVRAKLADPNFTGKVPQKVLDEHRQREADWVAQRSKLQEILEALE